MSEIQLAAIFVFIGMGLGVGAVVLVDALLGKNSDKDAVPLHAYHAPEPPDWFRPRVRVHESGDASQKLLRYETRRWFSWRFFYAEMMEKYARSYKNEAIFDASDLDQYGVLRSELIREPGKLGSDMTYEDYIKERKK